MVALDPVTTKDLENYHSRLKGEGIRQEFTDLFTDPQQELIVNLYKPDGVLAFERKVSMVHVNENLHQAARRIGLKGRYAILGLTVFAAEAGLLRMDGVPAGRTAGLGKKERKTLASYYSMTIEEAAQADGAKKSAIEGRWSRIFKKLDTSDRRQAVLMAIKDGLIESGTEERKSELRAIIERSQNPDLKDYNRFTSQQLAIMRIMDRSNKEIAEALGYADITVRVEISKAAQTVGLTGRFGGVSLAIRAVGGGILSLDNVVSGRTKKLNKEEKDLLKNHYMQTSSEVAKSKATTNKVVNKIWTNVYDKLGTRDRRIAALMAIKDGLIVPPENNSEKRA